MLKATLVLFICLSISTGVVLTALDSSTLIFGLETIILCAVIAFLVQWLVFIPSYLKRTEKLYDIAGSLTFVLITCVALFSNEYISLYKALISLMVIIWALRLGFFLYTRIQATGKDDRFEHLKKNKYSFFIAWTIQGLWIFLTSSPALVTLTASQYDNFNFLVILGLMIWLLGFSIEIISDQQKLAFKKKNKDQFINQGLWKYSRHPNYFGEILLWIGLTICVLPALSGWQYIVVVSPLFVILLLTKISGVPLLEAKAEKKWGDDTNYQKYKQNTSRIVLWFTNKK